MPNIIYKAPKISPLKQAGSWQLREYLVIVKKEQFHAGFFPVEIVQMNPYGVIDSSDYNALTPCGAALLAVKLFFGEDSAELDEFQKHYPCDKAQPSKQGYKMKDDLELGSVDTLPVWIRGGRV